MLLHYYNFLYNVFSVFDRVLKAVFFIIKTADISKNRLLLNLPLNSYKVLYSLIALNSMITVATPNL